MKSERKGSALDPLGPEAPDPRPLREGIPKAGLWRGAGQSPAYPGSDCRDGAPGLAEQIAFLSRCLEGTHIALFELTNGQDLIRLRPGTRLDTSGRTSAPLASVSQAPLNITAPTVGIFRRAHPERSAPLAEAGQHIIAGDSLGVLEIGALLIHVVAPKDGIVLDIPAEDGAAVGYGTVLVRFTERAEQ